MVQPYNNSNDKKNEVRAMFNNIARNYDLLNHMLSFGIDVLWRKRLISILKRYKSNNVLDIATGTADLAIMAAKSGVASLTGIDLSEKMVAEGINKVQSRSLSEVIKLEVGDAENLPFDDECFDAAMVAFGVRNFADLKAGLRDINRVLTPGSPFIVLEFSQPKMFLVRHLYHFYSFYILPLLGRIISKDRRAYMYLPESIKKFPAGDDFLKIMSECGYTDLKQIPLTFRIATIYIGHK